MKKISNKNSFPFYGWIGIILIGLFWYINWYLEGLRSHWGFFFLWIGFVLTVDALVFWRKGNSLISRNIFSFIGLFLISAPAWWLFEFFNEFLNNWQYIGKNYFSDLEYFLLSSLSFSTVIPAVFESSELVSTFNSANGKSDKESYQFWNYFLRTLILTGIILVILVITFPTIFYPFVWIAVYLIIDPINYKLENKSLLKFVENHNWKPFINLSLGALLCGFFWEMWNYYSYPKWVYNLPMVNFLHIFEMPVLGFIGYIPFAWELFALYHLVMGFIKPKSEQEYVRVQN